MDHALHIDEAGKGREDLAVFLKEFKMLLKTPLEFPDRKPSDEAEGGQLKRPSAYP